MDEAVAKPLWPDWCRPGHPDVAGIGECSLDQVCEVEQLPPFGSQAPLRSYNVRPGGTIATALLACTRFGLRCAFAGSVGDDPGARVALAPLEAAGIDLARVRSVTGARTRLAVILVEAGSGERLVLGYRDARLGLEASFAPADWARRARALLVDTSELPAALAAAEEARAAGVPVVLDADRLAPGVEELVQQVDFPIVSRAFAEELSDTGSPREALRRLVAWGARLAVVTLGAQGLLALDRERELALPAVPVSPVDTTGAGDVFHAAFVWGLLRGLDAETLLWEAAAAAALASRGAGAQGALPTAAEVEAFLAQERGGRP